MLILKYFFSRNLFIPLTFLFKQLLLDIDIKYYSVF